MRAEGMNATVSSIHINGWFGDHNKWAAPAGSCASCSAATWTPRLDRWVYVGDSTNDVLMFEHFPHSVGVANIRRFEPQLSHLPRYITQRRTRRRLRGGGGSRRSRHVEGDRLQTRHRLPVGVVQQFEPRAVAALGRVQPELGLPARRAR